MEQITTNLKYIHNVLQGDNFQSYKPIMAVIIAETVAEVREKQFVYQVEFTKESWKSHVGTYKNYAERQKSILLANLEEVHGEIISKNTNTKRCRVILSEVLNTNLYQNRVKKKLNNWVHLNMKKPVLQTTKVYAN